MDSKLVVGIAGILYLVFVNVTSRVIARRKLTADSVKDFVMAGGTVGYLLLSGTFIAAWCSTFTLFATAEAGFLNGISGVVWYPIGVAGPVLFSFFLARSLKRKFPQGMTLADWIGTRFGNGSRLILSVAILFAMLLEVIAALYVASNLLSILGGIPITVGILMLAASLLFNALFGGLNAVIYADLIRVITFLAFGIICIPYLLNQVGGAGAIYGMMSTEFININQWGIPDMQYFWFSLLGYTIGSAAIWQRIFAAKDEEVVEKTFVVFAIGWFPFAILGGTLGLLAIKMGVNVEPGLIVHFLISTVPLWLQVLFMLIFLAVIISSADTFLNAAVSTYAVDLEFNFLGKGKSDKHVLHNAKIFTVIYTIVAVILTIFVSGVIDLLTFAGMVLFGTVVVILASIFWDEATRKGGFYGMLVGVIFSTTSYILKWPLMQSAISTLVLSGVVLVIVSKMDKDKTIIEYENVDLSKTNYKGLSNLSVYIVYAVTYITVTMPFWSSMIAGLTVSIVPEWLFNGIIWSGPVGVVVLMLMLIWCRKKDLDIKKSENEKLLLNNTN